MSKIPSRDELRHLEYDPNRKLPAEDAGKKWVSPSFSIDSLVKGSRESENNDVAKALESARNSLEEGEIIATVPQIVAAKSLTDRSSYLWKKWFNGLSEEYVGLDSDKNPTLLVIHGAGLLTPERIRKARDDGLINHGAGRVSGKEWSCLLNGKVGGIDVPVYSLSDLGSHDIFGQYAIQISFDSAKANKTGRLIKSDFMKNELTIARAGGKQYLEDYFGKAQHSTEKDVGNHHWYGNNDFNPSTASGRLLFVDRGYGGLGGNDDLCSNGRFLGVAPEAHDAKKLGGEK